METSLLIPTASNLRWYYLCVALLFTPFCINAQPSCGGVWGPPIINQTFGQGNATANWYGPLSDYAPGASTSTIFVGASGPATGSLADNYSGLVKNSAAPGTGQGSNWISQTDHTGDPFGLMLLINAPSTAATIFFEYTMDSLCPNTTLKLSVWVLNVNSGVVPASTCGANTQYPDLTLQVVDPTTNAILASAPTGLVPLDSSWHQYSVIFNNGNNSSVKLQIVNNSVGSGCGNDLALDDIMVEPCVPVSNILPRLDTVVCQNTTFDLYANVVESPYDPAEYQWQYSINNGMTWLDQGVPSSNNTHTFNASTSNPGTYWVRFKTGPKNATSNDNCIAVSDTTVIIVSDPPIPPQIAYNPQYCTGMPFEGFSIMSGTNIKWYNSLTDSVGTYTPPVVNTDVPGNYRWFASQTTAQGCESGRTLIEISVTQSPEADFDFDIGYDCSRDTVHFKNHSTNAAAYLWNFGDDFFDTSTNPVHIYKIQNRYAVTLTAVNGYCSDSVTRIIDVNHPLHAGFSVPADTICEGSAVEFTDTSIVTSLNNLNPVYFWDFGDGTSSSLQNPVHQYSQPGVYEVMMVVSNFVPCADTAYGLIFVDSMPVLSFIPDDTLICQGDKIGVTARYSKSGLTQLQWNFGDGPEAVSNINPVAHAYDRAGTYALTLTGFYRICPDTTTSVEIKVKPVPGIDLGPDASICLNGSPLFLKDSINAGNPNAKWLWNTGDTTSSVAVRHYGSYRGTVSIEGCSATDEVIIRKDCFIDLPNSFTPDGDGLNDYFFPRQLLSGGLTRFTMTIYNRWGQKVFHTDNPSGRGWDGKFNTKDQPTGVYVYNIKVEMKNGRVEEYTGNVTLLR